MMLSVQGVESHYGAIQALFGVSLEVAEGEIVALIGANGAGKTTLLNLVSGLIRPTAGRIAFEGEEIAKASTQRIVDLGVVQVPEGRQVFSDLSVVDNLEMGAYRRARRLGKRGLKKEMGAIFDLFPILSDRRRQRGGTLSGGEQQMLAIGRALMAGPRLLLLDEPSLGLAPMVVVEIMEVIKRLKEEGTTILLVEQNARAALNIADRAYVLKTGRTALGGPAGELLEDEAVQKAFLGRGAKER